MHHIDTILYPYLLIENNHLNLYNIEFDNESLLKFVDKFKNIWITQMVDNVRLSQEITDEQKNILINCFQNLKHFIYSPVNKK
jgi:hypothetical protein